jgi:hypothetical protein
MTELEPHKIVSIGVDWLTATAYRTRANEPFRDLGRRLLSGAVKQGNDVSTWKAQGYRGLKSSGVREGLRHDTHIIQLSGDEALDNWRAVADLATNVSRLDLQVTFEMEVVRPDFFERQHAAARDAVGGRGRKSNVTFITSRLTGDSLYLGQRTSDIYARCYDKGMESKCAPRGKLIRHELEMKRDVAKSAVARLREGTSEAVEIASMVCSHMSKQSLATPTHAEIDRESARARLIPDNDRRLRWLRGAVKPSVEHLIRAGRVAEVLESLGLMEVAEQFYLERAKSAVEDDDG